MWESVLVFRNFLYLKISVVIVAAGIGIYAWHEPLGQPRVDACMNVEGGHACVRACPTGAAFRISPEEYFTTDYLVR